MADDNLNIELLGNFRLSKGERQVSAVDTPRMQALLAYLILNRRSPQPRQYIAFIFWPDTSEKQARTNLRQLLHHLRTALPGVENLIAIDNKNLQWKQNGSCKVDVIEFDELLLSVKTNASSQSLDVQKRFFESAVQLYKGDLLPGCYDEWIMRERDRLKADYNFTLEQLVKLHSKEGDFSSAIKYAHLWLKEDELCETVYSLLMQLYKQRNDRAGALRVFHQCVATLRKELNVKPGAEVQMIYRQILNDNTYDNGLYSSSSNLSEGPPLIGRNTEWEILIQTWHFTLTGKAHFVVVEGEPGIGKSRLCYDFLHWAKSKGTITAHTRCYAAAENLSYAPVKKWLESEVFYRKYSEMEEIWLTELARLLPDILVKNPHIPPPGPLTENWQRQKFYESMAHAILNIERPLLLILDDIQWCDNETLSWLLYLMNFKTENKILIVSSLRDTELPGSHPLIPFLTNLKNSSQSTHIKLKPLNEYETGLLVSRISERRWNDELIKKIFTETEGNPLFIVEILREGILDEILKAKKVPTIFPGIDFPGGIAIPRKVYDIFHARLNQLSSSARALIELASAIGREFSYKSLVLASDFSEDFLINALDELWHRHIIREQGADAYDFSHDKLREVAYTHMSTAKRRRMHLLIAGALEKLQESTPEEIFNSLAFHYDHANLPEKAIPHYQKAASKAIRLYANQEASRYLNRALSLLKFLPQNNNRDELELEILVSLNLTFVHLKGYGAAEIHSICSRIINLSRQLGAVPSAPALRIMAIGKLATGDTLHALSIGEQLLYLSHKNGDRVVKVEGHYVLGVINFWLGNFILAKEHLELAIASYKPEQQNIHIHHFAQNPKVVCLVRLSLTLWCLGYQTQALQKCEEALSMAKDISHPFSLAYALHFASWLASLSGDLKLASGRVNETIKLSENQDFTYWSLVSKIQQGWIIAKQGDVKKAIAMMGDAMENYRATGMKLGWQYFCTLMAEAYLLDSRPEKAIETVDEGIETAFENHFHYYNAELYRVKANILWKELGGIGKAENCLNDSIKIAQGQSAKTFEFKSTKDLCLLWQEQGKQREAKMRFQEVSDRFSKDIQSGELQEASNLLNH